MKHRICFIDDDAAFEIPLFEQVFGDRYDIVSETSFEAAVKAMEKRGAWKPELFVLDLYFPTGHPDQDEIKALTGKPLVFEDDHAQLRASYTNYVRAESRLIAVLSAWRQGAQGGLALAQRVIADFPGVPILFYSRKANFEDAVRCMALPGVHGVQKKPTGNDDEETRRITMARQEHLVRRFDGLLTQSRSDDSHTVNDASELVWKIIRPMLYDEDR